MLAVITAGVAPGLALLSYFYLKDQYTTKPFGIVAKTFLFGALLVFPIMFVQYAFMEEEVVTAPWQEAFLLAGLLEEFIKWFILMVTIYMHVQFKGHYEGIVYGVAISLGFATVENILYLMENGLEFAFGRAMLPVSSHALYGVIMGFYLGKAKAMETAKDRNRLLFLSLFTPFLLHGAYDYILLTVERYWVYWIVPFMLMLWWNGMRKVKLANSNAGQNDGFFDTDNMPME